MSMGKNLAILPIKTPLGFYFYETNRNEVVAVNKELYDYISAVLSGNVEIISSTAAEIKEEYINLEECGYLQPFKIYKIEHPLTNQIEDLIMRRMDKITLQVTQNCNLRCSYCIYSENSNLGQRSHSSSVMSFETAQRALDFYREHSIDSDLISIGFYGGEPLLAYPLIVKIVSYAETIFEGKPINYSITTNATLLTDSMIDYLIEKEFNVLISIDGPEKIQNANRKFPDGRGSYDIVINNIRKFYSKISQKSKKISISMVVDPAQDYSEIIKLFDEPELKNADLNYTFIEEDAQYLKPTEEYIVKYTYDMFLTLVSHFRENELVVKSKLVKTDLDAMIDGNKRFKMNLLGNINAPSGPCLPGKLRMLVNCFGEFYPCERVNENSCMRIGSLDTGFDFEKINNILNVGKIAEEDCKKCWAFSLCSICAKRTDDGGKMTDKRKKIACKDSKLIAYNKIMNKILAYENEVHMRKITNRGMQNEETMHNSIY